MRELQPQEVIYHDDKQGRYLAYKYPNGLTLYHNKPGAGNMQIEGTPGEKLPPKPVPSYKGGSSIGAVPAGGVFEDNTRKWAGDHIIDPALVPGVLLMNRPFRREGARLVDLAPTLLAALGAPAVPAPEGSSLLS